MSELAKKKCSSCEDKDLKPLSREEALVYMPELKDWKLSDNAKMISKEWIFKDFVKSVSFVNQVTDVAEMEGHHPDVHIHYNKVLLELSTHSIGGLSDNDFILAAKLDELWLI